MTDRRSPPGADDELSRLPARPGTAVVRLSTRLVRRGALLLAAASAAYMWLEVASFTSTYPNGVSEDEFAIFVDNPAARMLQGVPRGIDTAAGFAAWDGGWLLQMIAGVWGLLVVSRLLRGEEDSGRAELTLVGPVSAGRVAGLQLTVVYTGILLTGVAVTAALLATGSEGVGALLFGLGLAGFAATFAGVSAVTSQVVGVRRRAAGIAAAVMGVSFLLRMVANSTDSRAWVGWFTPFGWMDHLQAFGDPVPLALVLLLLTPVVLFAATVLIRGRRDTGGALLAGTDSRDPRLRGLGSPMAFAWRSNQAVLLGWVLGLGAYAFIIGSLLSTMIEWIAGDAEYQRLMNDLGLGLALTADGFLGVMGVVLGLAFAVYAAWRMGAARAEEESERVENFLTRPVTRTRWLAGHTLLTLVGAALLTLLTGLALWAGSQSAGSSDVTLDDALRSVLNTGSVVILVTGLAVLAFGLVPRLTTAVPIAVAVVGYVLALLGPALAWPQWVVDLSPFAHLAYVPAQPFAATSAAVMVALGAGATACGVLAFNRRDVTGA